MPMFEAYVSLAEVNVMLRGIWISCGTRGAVNGMAGWRRLFHTLVDEMAVGLLAYTEPSGVADTFVIPINRRNCFSEDVRR